MGFFNWFFRSNNNSSPYGLQAIRNQTQSGVCVTAATAMQIGAVNACIRVISEDIASASFHVYKRTPKGRQRAPEHPVYRLINEQPNEDMTAIDFWQLVVTNLLAYGNSPCYIMKQNERPTDLIPLHPRCTKAVRQGGKLVYNTEINGVKTTLTQDRILHYRLMSSGDDPNGKGVIQQAPEVLGVAQAADLYSARFFGEGTHLNGYLKQAVKLTAAQEKTLLETWRDQYSSVARSHQTPILPFGVEHVPTDLPPEETQLLTSKMFSAIQICGMFRVQPPKIGILDKSSFNTLEQVEISHVRSTLRPHACRIEQETHRKLFAEFEKPIFYPEFDLDSLMRGDRASQDKSWATGIQWGWYSKNDVRRQQNLPEIESGDVYLSPLNMQSTQDQPADPATNQNSLASPLTSELAKRVATKIGKAIERKAKSERNLGPWLTAYLDDKEVLFRQSLEPALEPWKLDEVIESMREKLVDDLADAVTFDAVPEYIKRLPDVLLGLMETND